MQTSWSYSLVDTSLTLYTSDTFICCCFFIHVLNIHSFIIDEAVTAGPIVCKPRWGVRLRVRLFQCVAIFMKKKKLFWSAMLTYWHLKVKLWLSFLLFVCLFFYVYLMHKMQVKELSIKKFLILKWFFYIFFPAFLCLWEMIQKCLHGWVCLNILFQIHVFRSMVSMLAVHVLHK